MIDDDDLYALGKPTLNWTVKRQNRGYISSCA